MSQPPAPPASHTRNPRSGRPKDLLVILNPRRIRECLVAFDELPIDRLWVKSMREIDIVNRWQQVMETASGYDRLLVVSDDGVVRPHALQAVQTLLDQGFPVATGYSNLSSTDFRVNLTKTPLRGDPGPDAYNLYTLAEIMESEQSVVPTFFAGMCLTGMSYELWERYPFNVWNGYAQSDFSLCKRLYADRVPIVAAREGFVWHVKEEWNRADTAQRKKPVIGDLPPEVVLERYPERIAA